jgi:predicted O-methyltransferase YrrM
MQRLRQIPPETGRFLTLMLAGAPDGNIVEIGTSAGYSTLWLALACENEHRTLITFEVLPEKVTLSQETFKLAEVDEIIPLIQGDARHFLPDMD